ELAEGLRYVLTVEGKSEPRTFPKRDQFAPELVYFSQCVVEDTQPEPSGIEGLADVRVIGALYTSARERRSVPLGLLEKKRRPNLSQEMHKPAVRKRRLIHAQSPSE